MTGPTLAAIVIPIVVAVALAAWIGMVYHANRNPHGSSRGEKPDREVTGGTFEGDRRQWMPRRDAEPREVSEAMQASGVRTGGGDGNGGGEESGG